MKRSSYERRVSMSHEKHVRAENAKKYESQRRDDTHLGHRLVTVNYGHGYAIEDGRASVSGRQFFSHLNSKKNRRQSLLETKNQLLDKFFVEEEERLRIEALLEKYDDSNDEMSFKSIINLEEKKELEEVMA